MVALRTADRAQRNQDLAESAANLADARRASAQAPLHEDVSTALLLGVAALQVDTSPQAWENLGAALMRTPSLVGVRDAGGAVVSFAASPDGSLLAASLPGKGEGVQLFDAGSLEPVAFGDDTPASAVAFSPNGRQLAVAVNQWVFEGPPRIDPGRSACTTCPAASRQPQLGGLPEGSSASTPSASARTAPAWRRSSSATTGRGRRLRRPGRGHGLGPLAPAEARLRAQRCPSTRSRR